MENEIAAALLAIVRTLEDHPDANRGNSKVHFALCKARGALAELAAAKKGKQP